MKAITIWQPWASFLAAGVKQYETRSWATNYRGPIAIHAGQKGVPEFVTFLKEYDPVVFFPESIKVSILKRSCIIATAELVGIYPIIGNTLKGGKQIEAQMLKNRSIVQISGNELLLGDWAPGRFAWEFVNMTPLPVSIPAKGKQRLWNIDLYV